MEKNSLASINGSSNRTGRNKQKPWKKTHTPIDRLADKSVQHCSYIECNRFCVRFRFRCNLLLFPSSHDVSCVRVYAAASMMELTLAERLNKFPLIFESFNGTHFVTARCRNFFVWKIRRRNSKTNYFCIFQINCWHRVRPPIGRAFEHVNRCYSPGPLEPFFFVRFYPRYGSQKNNSKISLWSESNTFRSPRGYRNWNVRHFYRL